MKILNLYSGIGGNRKLWGDTHQIDAVELDPEIAAIYKDFYPGDNVIVADAHQFLLDHYKEYDFIWSSPPCPTHSQFSVVRTKSECVRTGNAGSVAKYPDMTLYQEIILLREFAKCHWVVENVKPYYQPLISATAIQRHLFWSDMIIPTVDSRDDKETNIKDTTATTEIYGISLANYKHKDKRKLLRNMVNPAIGKYILDIAMGTSYKIDNLEIFDSISC